MQTLQTYCVSHEKPWVPAKLYTREIGIGDYYPKRGTHISSIDPYWHGMRDCAYGAAGNYSILQAIKQERERPGLTGIFSHRKVVVRRQIGTVAPHYPVYREISPAQAATLSPEDAAPNEGQDFLVGMPVSFQQGVLRQYVEFHRAVDMYAYLSMAADSGVLTSDDVQAFAFESVFIPGGCELGIYPTDWLFESLSKLELLARMFLTRYSGRIKSYDAYQVRAVGFLAERLGSFLLLKELMRRYPNEFPVAAIGYLCVVVPEGTNYDAAVTE